MVKNIPTSMPRKAIPPVGTKLDTVISRPMVPRRLHILRRGPKSMADLLRRHILNSMRRSIASLLPKNIATFATSLDTRMRRTSMQRTAGG